jgi:hypothetical protein
VSEQAGPGHARPGSVSTRRGYARRGFGHLEESNIAKLFFLDERAKELHPQWAEVAREVVANLRAACPTTRIRAW